MHHFLAVLYELNGDEPAAIRHYEKAIELDATLGEARNNLAYLLASDDARLDRALDLAQEAKALMPDSPNAADTLGWVLFRRGIASAAVGYLREAEAGMQSDDPNLSVIRWHLAQAYAANGEPAKAIASIDRALENQPDGQASPRMGRRSPRDATEARKLLDARQPAAPGIDRSRPAAAGVTCVTPRGAAPDPARSRLSTAKLPLPRSGQAPPEHSR